MRRFGWFELGFTEDFLVRLFSNAGFTARRIECQASVYGEGYIFEHRGASVVPSEVWLSKDVEAGWNNPEPNGRWTKSESRLYLDTLESFTALVIDATNHHPVGQSIEITYGSQTLVVPFAPGERKEILVGAHRKAPEIVIRSPVYVPAKDHDPKSDDSRALGIFVHSISYFDKSSLDARSAV
jgi:hypothetical protein